MKIIKIFATQSQSCSKENFIKNEIFTPVLGGAACKKNGGQIQGDDEGKNISNKNDIFCELTTQYWAWKNVEADYYGFCHYRRYFSFNTNKLECDEWGIVNFKYADGKTKKDLNLEHTQRIHHTVEAYDILLPVKINLKKIGHRTVYEQFQKTPHMKIECLDVAMEVIREKYPDYEKAAKKYIYGSYFYPFNMFIMRRAIFQHYSKWLFDILFQVTERLNLDTYSIQSRRIPAHIGERLFGVYITYLLETIPSLKVKELQVGFIHNADIADKLSPAFSSRNVPVVMASNESFAPILSAALYSMVCSSSKEWHYDVVILERDILNKTKQRLKKMVEKHNNFSLRFYHVGALIEKYDLYVSKLITIETYYRFLIPKLFRAYKRVLYLDGDIIVKRDLSELYRIDIGKNLVAACHDVTCAGLVNGFDEEHLRYCKNKMKLKNPLNQFNAGVLIMNLDEFRSTYTTSYMLRFAEKGKFRYWDQDALNILCEGRVYWLDSAWNYFADEKGGWRGNIDQFAPKSLYMSYQEAADHPYIYHFAGNEKPWFDPNYEYAEIFWKYLKETPFYEIMLQRRMTETTYYFINKNKEEMPFESLRHLMKRVLIAVFPAKTIRGKAVRKLYIYAMAIRRALNIIGKRYSHR